MAGAVPAVCEPARSVAWRDRGEGGPGGGAEVVVGARLGLAEGVLDFREGVLDRIEVRRVGREMTELGSPGLDGGADARRVMGPQVVGDDDLPRPERRSEAVADVALEASAGHPPVKAEHRADPIQSQRRDHGLVLALVARRRGNGALSARRPGVRRRVAQMTARLVEEDQILWPDRLEFPPPGGPRRLVPFARRQPLFLRVQPSRVRARLIVAVLTSTPELSRHQEHCSANVASARSASRSGNAASSAAVFTATGPGTGFGARSPVSRRCLSHRSIVGTDTAKRRATSLRGVPLDTAHTTRQRRSSEYGFILTA
jgi:hypothetical protein